MKMEERAGRGGEGLREHGPLRNPSLNHNTEFEWGHCAKMPRAPHPAQKGLLRASVLTPFLTPAQRRRVQRSALNLPRGHQLLFWSPGSNLWSVIARPCCHPVFQCPGRPQRVSAMPTRMPRTAGSFRQPLSSPKNSSPPPKATSVLARRRLMTSDTSPSGFPSAQK